jgi:hypothetical protein
VPQLLASLKLPADALSENLVRFFQFFSLPLEPRALAELRRAVLSLPQPDGQPAGRKSASALGAAAAAAKGLVLESGALAEYAAAIDPAGREGGKQGGFAGGSSQSGGAGGSGDGADGQSSSGQAGAGSGDGAGQGSAGNQPGAGGQGQGGWQKPTAAEVEKAVRDVLERGPIPDFINRIPAKDGRRWVVLPFSFSRDGLGVEASFRIMLGPGPAPEAESFAADVLVSPAGEGQADADGSPGQAAGGSGDSFLVRKKHWIFSLSKNPGGASAGRESAGNWRLDYAAEPEEDAPRLGKRLAALFGLAEENVRFRRDMALFAGQAESAGTVLRTIDKEV